MGPTPEMNCICFEPDSRSRASGTTNCAATKAKGMRIMMAAKSETNDEICALVWSESGSGCIEPSMCTASPVRFCASASYIVFTIAGAARMYVELNMREPMPREAISAWSGVTETMGVLGE